MKSDFAEEPLISAACDPHEPGVPGKLDSGILASPLTRLGVFTGDLCELTTGSGDALAGKRW